MLNIFTCELVLGFFSPLNCFGELLPQRSALNMQVKSDWESRPQTEPPGGQGLYCYARMLS